MRRLASIGSVLVLGIALASAASAALPELSSVRIASGLDRPVFATSPPQDHGRLFIVEQHSGKIKIFDRTTGLVDHANPFLTVGDLATDGEQGLLGLAFHPNYANNGLFYIHRTRADDSNVIDEYQVSGDPNVASTPATRELLVIAQPQRNHNGGWIGFGPDGYLYIAIGDGGNGDDQGSGHIEPTGNAQFIGTLLGKILRIDVDTVGASTPYGIPPGNPFVGIGRDEIWAYGLRNPWRASFDRATGDFWIGDVGQNVTEEVDVQPANSTGGENYGWRLREGTTETPTFGIGGPRPPGAIDPIYDYPHLSSLFAVTGGYVYRGPVAALQGSYVFGDIGGPIWALDFDGSDPSTFDGTNFTNFRPLTADLAPDQGTIGAVASFGEDADGNLYIVDLGGTGSGEVFLVVPSPDAGSAGIAALFALTLLAARGCRRCSPPRNEALGCHI